VNILSSSANEDFDLIMKTTILFSGILIIFGFSCVVRGDNDSNCAKLVDLRIGFLNTLYFPIIVNALSAQENDKICPGLAIMRSKDVEKAVECEEAKSSHKTLLEKLKKKTDLDYGILCENPGAIEKSVECIKDSKKEDKLESKCSKPFMDNSKIKVPNEEAAGNLALFGQVKMITNKNKITVCSALDELLSCYKTLIPKCKTIHENLGPMLYDLVDLQLTEDFGKNSCPKPPASKSSNFSCRLQCLQPIPLVTATVIVMYILSQLWF